MVLVAWCDWVSEALTRIGNNVTGTIASDNPEKPGHFALFINPCKNL
jgi:hypothetical protein